MIDISGVEFGDVYKDEVRRGKKAAEYGGLGEVELSVILNALKAEGIDTEHLAQVANEAGVNPDARFEAIKSVLDEMPDVGEKLVNAMARRLASEAALEGPHN